MDMMFKQASSFDSDMSAWDVAQVADMDSMCNAATSFQQDLCARADTFKYDDCPRDIFAVSGCKYSVDPQSAKQGRFCASTCQAVTVVWSTVSCPCSVGDFVFLPMLLNDLLYFPFHRNSWMRVKQQTPLSLRMPVKLSLLPLVPALLE